MAQGKYFVIRSQLNGLVIDVAGASTDPGTPLVTFSQKFDENDNQLFYEDVTTGTIRSKLNDFAIDIEKGGLFSPDKVVLNPYQLGNSNQQWMVAGNRIQSRYKNERTLDIEKAKKEPGANIIVWNYSGDANQLWDIEYIKPKYFYIRSEMHEKVVDIRDALAEPGQKVIMWGKKEGVHENQLWYEDSNGIIRSKMGDFVLDSTEGSVRLQPYDQFNPNQQWIISGNKIMNRVNPMMVIDIRDEDSWDGAKLCSFDYMNRSNQHWYFDILDW